MSKISSHGAVFRLALCLLGLSVLASPEGCVLGPDQHRPHVETPRTWEELAAGETDTTVRMNTAKGPEFAWWRVFQNGELNRLMVQALEENHDMRRAAMHVMGGRDIIMVSAGTGLFPQLTALGSYANIGISKNTLADLGLASGNRSPQSFATPGTGFNLYNTALDLRWELDLCGRIQRGLEAASADAQALEQNHRGVALTLMADVGTAYFQLRQFDETIRNCAARPAEPTRVTGADPKPVPGWTRV